MSLALASLLFQTLLRSTCGMEYLDPERTTCDASVHWCAIFSGSHAYHNCLLPVVTLLVKQQTKRKPRRQVSIDVTLTLPVVRKSTSTTGTPVGVSRIASMSGPNTNITVCHALSAISIIEHRLVIDTYNKHDEADDTVGHRCSDHRPDCPWSVHRASALL